MKASELTHQLKGKQRSINDLSNHLITRSHKQPNYTLLLGAGASSTSGVKTAEYLIDEWRREQFNSIHGGLQDSEYSDDLAAEWLASNCDWYNRDKEYACFLERKFDLQSLRRIFIEGQIIDSFPSIGYSYISNLVENGFINTIFTTNFDDLINESFSQFSDIRPIVCAHDSSVTGISITLQRPKIIKLHGDYLYENVRCTPNQVSQLERNMEDKLSQFLKEYGLIISGYSGRDESVLGVLDKLINDPHITYLPNGVYWCFRPSDKICDRVLEFLKKPRVFYVLCDGFDELFSELCESTQAVREIQPYSGTNFGRLRSKVIKNWLENKYLQNNPNPIIKGKLAELKKESGTYNVSQAISNFVSRDKDIDDDHFNDDETIALLESDNLSRLNKHEERIRHALKLISETSDKEFAKRLHLACFSSYIKIQNRHKALEVADQLIALDPDVPSNYIRKASVLGDDKEAIALLDKAIHLDEFSWHPHHEKAEKLIHIIDYSLVNSTDHLKEEIIKLLKKSIECRPSIHNPSWRKLAEFLLKGAPKSNLDVPEFDSIIQSLTKQDKHSPITLGLLLSYATHFETSEYKGKSLFDCLADAEKLGYPRRSARLFAHMVDLSIEFKNHSFAKRYLSAFEEQQKGKENKEIFIKAKARFYLEINKDLSKAKSCLADWLAVSRSVSVANRLIAYASLDNDLELINRVFSDYKDSFTFADRVQLQSKIYALSDNFEKANEELERLCDEPDFDSEHGGSIVFNLLQAKKYDEARDYAHTILHRANFVIKPHLEVLMLNYEFAWQKCKKHNRKNKRLFALAEHGSSRDIKAVANCLLGNYDLAVQLLLDEIDTEYSNIYMYNSWPILEQIVVRLNQVTGFKQPELKAISCVA